MSNSESTDTSQSNDTSGSADPSGHAARISTDEFDRMWADLQDVGTHAAGGYSRFAWTRADHTLREWFAGEAGRRSMDLETDRNGNLWAWWGTPGPGAFVTGSHLDSVPGGGAYDGPLGVVSAFAAVDRLRADGLIPTTPIAVTCFSDEEGARFGVACIGSRLTAGVLTPENAKALRDVDGMTLDEAMRKAGQDPTHIGPDQESLDRVGVFVELHVEQGRGLIDLDAPIAVASSIWPHGRWRMSFVGEGNHAGTTRLEDRQDPMLTYAETVLSVRKRARLAGAVATVGRVAVHPNGTNAIASSITAWLDTRAPDEVTVDEVVEQIKRRAEERAERDGVRFEIVQESHTGRVEFDPAVQQRLVDALPGEIPVLGTGAGHDAGILSSVVPTGMLFVRNPTGISHSPDEFAEIVDCHAGVAALAAVMADYAGARG